LLLQYIALTILLLQVVVAVGLALHLYLMVAEVALAVY
jgi:hypothetical protein